MKKKSFENKIVFRLYIKYLVLIFVVIFISSWIVYEYKTEKRMQYSKIELRKKGLIVDESLKKDMENSLKWVHILTKNQKGIKMFKSEEDLSLLISEYMEVNPNIKRVFLLNNENKIKLLHSKSSADKKEFKIEQRKLKEIKTLEENEVYINFINREINKLGINYYFPIGLDGEERFYLGVSYCIDMFFKNLEDELEELFDYNDLGTLESKVDGKVFFYFNGEEKIKKSKEKHKVNINFNVILDSKKWLEDYGRSVKLSRIISKDNAVLTLYLSEKEVQENKLRYLYIDFLFFVILSVIAWWYTIERFEGIRKVKRIKYLNNKLERKVFTKMALLNLGEIELKAPLRGSLKNIEILKREINIENKEALSSLKNIKANVFIISQIMNGLTQWLAIEKFVKIKQKEDFNLSELLNKEKSSLEEYLEEKRIKLEISIKKDIVIKTDKNLFEKIIRNLLMGFIENSEVDNIISVLIENKEKIVIKSEKDLRDLEEYKLKKDNNYFSKIKDEKNKEEGEIWFYLAEYFSRKNESKLKLSSYKGNGKKATISLKS